MTEEERKEKNRLYAEKYYAKNKEKAKDYAKDYAAKKRKESREAKAKHRLENPDQYVKTSWKKRNPEKVKAQRDRYYANNKDKAKASTQKWQDENKDRFTKSKNEYKKRKKIKDPIYAMTERIRSRTAMAFKKNGFKKNSTTEKMLGCTFKQFTKHIEKQFTDGMSWDNRSQWHLDHILPLSCATTIEGLEKLSYYTNIRPLWAADNLSKSDNLVLV